MSITHYSTRQSAMVKVVDIGKGRNGQKEVLAEVTFPNGETQFMTLHKNDYVEVMFQVDFDEQKTSTAQERAGSR